MAICSSSTSSSSTYSSSQRLALLCRIKVIINSLVLLAYPVQGGRQCMYRGVVHAPGSIIEDSCSLCICSKSGYVACRTQRDCEPKCTFNGRSYSHGERIFNREKCQLCHCFRGNINCSSEASNIIPRCFKAKPYCRLKDRNYQINEIFTREDGCTMCACRPGGYIICAKQRWCKNMCRLGNKTLVVGDSVLRRQRARFGQSQCAVCTCQTGGHLVCDRSHEKCHRLPTEGVCVYKDKVYFEAGRFQEAVGEGQCRQCQCNRNGFIACSAHPSTCPANLKTCSYKNSTYVAGDYFIETEFNYKYQTRKPTAPSPAQHITTSTSKEVQPSTSLRAKLRDALHQVTSGAKKLRLPARIGKKSGGKSAPTFGKYDCRLCSCDREGEVTCVDSQCRYRTCERGDQVYYAGQSFLEHDGCRACLCAADGVLRCQDRKCNIKLTQRTSASTCVHKGKTYIVNETFRTRQKEQCLLCTCAKFGEVQCKGTHCRSTSAESRFSCNTTVFFGMFLSTLKVCKLVEE